MKLLIAALFLVSCAAAPVQAPEGMHWVSDIICCEADEDRPLSRTYHIRSEASVGQPGQAMFYAIYGIEGVQSVYRVPYQYNITISPLYEWEDVEAELVKKVSELVNVYDTAVKTPKVDKSKGL